MDKKQSLILGALTSSAGIFVTKLMGIFYMVPFTALAGEGNLTYYSYAYGVYETLLNVSLAGIPYAVATIIAKYKLKNDYKAIEYLNKLTQGIMLGFGFISAAIMILGSKPIATYITPANISPEGLNYTRNTLMIIALAFFTVPLLAGVRGYFQGLKDMKVYAFSQVLEQFSRITFLLTVAFVTVSLIHLDGIYAVYGAVGSAFVSSLVALIHLYLSRRKVFRENRELAFQQTEETQDHKSLFLEMMNFAIPYLITTILGNSLNIVNTNFFSSAMDAAGYEAEVTSLLYQMVNLTTSKMTSIPHFLATGFSVAVIPYLTTCYEEKNVPMIRKYILDAIDSVLYLGLPLCFYLFAIGTEIYYVMYGSSTSYQLGGEVLRWATISAVLGTISPVINSLTMAVRLRKQNILFMAIGFAVKFISFFPLIRLFGYSGAITSSGLCSIVIITLDLWAMNRVYHIDFKPTMKKLFGICIGLASMYVSFQLIGLIGLNVIDQRRIIATCELAVYGGIGLIVYVAVTSLLKIPEQVFHLDEGDNIWKFLIKTLLRR